MGIRAVWHAMERTAETFWRQVARDVSKDRRAYCAGGPWHGRLVPEPSECQGIHFSQPAPGGEYVVTDDTIDLAGETLCCLEWRPDQRSNGH